MTISKNNIYCFYNFNVEQRVYIISLYDQRIESESQFVIEELGNTIKIVYDESSDNSIITMLSYDQQYIILVKWNKK